MNWLSGIWNSIGGPYIAAWPTVNLYAIPGAIIPVIYFQLRIGGSPWLWLGLGAVIYLSAIVVFVLARATVLPVTQRAARPGWAVLTYLAVVASRVIAVAAYSEVTGIGHTDYSPVRAWVIPVVNVFILMWFCEAVVTRVATYRAQMSQLQADERDLRGQRRALDEVASRDRAGLAQFARTALEPEIRSVLDALHDSGSAAAVPTLQSIVDNVVRPLTHQVEQHAAPEPTPVASEPESNAAFLRMSAPVSDLIMATPVSLFVLYGLGLVVIVTSGWSDFVPGTPIAIAVLWLMLLLAKRLFRGAQLAFVPAMALALLVFVVAAGVSVTIYDSIPGGSPYRQTWIGIISVAAGLMCAVYQFVGAHLDQTIRNQQAVNRELEQLTQRTRQEMWLNRKRAATNLHGHVQATLQVAAIQLARAPDLGARELDEISQRIRRALERIDEDETVSLADVEHALNGIADVWDQQAAVTWSMRTGAQHALRNDEQLCRAVVELATEATLNAIKHGDARAVQIDLDMRSPSIMQLRVTNTGRPISDDRTAGYGTRSLNELCLEWSLQSSAAGTVLEAQLVSHPHRGFGSAGS